MQYDRVVNWLYFIYEGIGCSEEHAAEVACARNEENKLNEHKKRAGRTVESPAGHDHMRARGMNDLRDVATVLYLFKINSVVSSAITFATQACATLAPYTKDMAAGSIQLGGVLLGQFLGLLQMFCSGLSKSPMFS